MKALIVFVIAVLIAIALALFIIAGNTSKDTTPPPQQELWQWCMDQPGGGC